MREQRASKRTGASEGQPIYKRTSPKLGLKCDGFGMQKERVCKCVYVYMSEDGRGLAAGSPISLVGFKAESEGERSCGTRETGLTVHRLGLLSDS